MRNRYSFSYEESKKIRESYLVLPFQGFWTWLTGKEVLGRRPLWNSRPIESLVSGISVFLVGVALSLTITLLDLPYWLLMISLTLTVSGQMNLESTVIHMCGHHLLFSSKKSNETCHEILSSMIFYLPYRFYRAWHIYQHHAEIFGTEKDSLFLFVINCGIKEGKAVKSLWLSLVLNLIDPRVHVRLIRARFNDNFIRVSPRKRRWYSFISLIIWFLVGFFVGLEPFLISIVLPVMLLKNFPYLVEAFCGHIWTHRNPAQKNSEVHAELSIPRFCGEKCPDGNLNLHKKVISWSVWAFRHLVYHFPSRLLIVPGTMPVHDWHHRHAGHADWVNSSRRREEEAGKLDEKAQYIEIWGIVNACNYVFLELSKSNYSPDAKVGPSQQ